MQAKSVQILFFVEMISRIPNFLKDFSATWLRILYKPK